MRHALITTRLFDEANSSRSRVPERALVDAPPDPAPAAAAAGPRPRRLATLVRRARALVVRPT